MKRFFLTVIGLSLLMGFFITSFTFASYNLPVNNAVSIAKHNQPGINKRKHHRKRPRYKYKRKIK